MSVEEVNEAPNVKTGGISTADQLVDVTSSTMFSVLNTTSEIAETAVAIVESPEKEEHPATVEFTQELRKSLHRNKDILKELAKY